MPGFCVYQTLVRNCFLYFRSSSPASISAPLPRPLQSNNIVKLKPPMCFTVADAARVCRELDEVMASLPALLLKPSPHPPLPSPSTVAALSRAINADVELHDA